MGRAQHKETTEQIWRELSTRLRQFVRSRIESAADVDDVLQTVFLRIHSKLDRLRNTDRLQSWIFQITRNAVADYFRQRKTVQDDVESLVDGSNTAWADNFNAEVAGCLRGLIERLPEGQRRALSMYELNGLSQKDIAIRESISLSGAKSRIQRGRKSLEAMLEACCEFQFDTRGNVVEFEVTSADCCDEGCGKPRTLPD